MLNISPINIKQAVASKKFSTLLEVESKVSGNTLIKLMYVSLIIIVITLFIPWTQNIRTHGNVTTITPNQKPQKITSILGGQIDRWYIQEGDFVQKGDTLLKITEVKVDYFDSNLVDRTKNQVDLKKQSIINYSDKINNQNQQIKLLENERDLKVSQSKIKLNQSILKVQSDSIAYQTTLIDLNIANNQLKRTDSLYRQGYKSLTDLEAKKLKQQQAESYKLKAENEWLNSKTGLLNLQMEISNIKLKYASALNKIESTQLSTYNNKIDAESSLNKLENQFSNYEFRSDLYYILAPQNGYVTKTSIGGSGEIIKPGQEVFTFMPQEYELAVEIFIEPMDLPLIEIGEKVRLQFDGWPAIIFSGWPEISQGTYGGEVYAIDQFISPNGKYRLLVKPDSNAVHWPEALRYGGGTSAMILLGDVPIWYELWRNINGFPPNFYKNEKPSPTKK